MPDTGYRTLDSCRVAGVWIPATGSCRYGDSRQTADRNTDIPDTKIYYGQKENSICKTFAGM